MAGHRTTPPAQSRPTQAAKRAERLSAALAADLAATTTPVQRLSVTTDFVRAVAARGLDEDTARFVDQAAAQLRDRVKRALDAQAKARRRARPAIPPHPSRSTHAQTPPVRRTG